MKVSKGELTGKKHIAKGMSIEDYVECIDNDKRAAIGCGDGCSSASSAQAAAMTNVQTMFEIFDDEEIWKNDDASEITSMIADRIYTKLKSRPGDVRQYAATLAAVGVNKASGMFLAVSVGDSYIDCWTKADGLRHLTEPYKEPVINGRDKGNHITCYTCNKSLTKSTMKVIKGKIDDVYAFMVYTDGLECMADRYQMAAELFSDAVRKTVTGSGESAIGQILRRAQDRTGDDICLAIMTTDDFAKDHQIIEKDEKKPAGNVSVVQNYIINAIADSPMTADDLIEAGVCGKGTVLRTMLPLIRSGLVKYSGGKFTAV